jgi:hypothetical protein
MIVEVLFLGIERMRIELIFVLKFDLEYGLRVEIFIEDN